MKARNTNPITIGLGVDDGASGLMLLWMETFSLTSDLGSLLSVSIEDWALPGNVEEAVFS
jgi:hypothetical protein